jgi:hypothetical protein
MKKKTFYFEYCYPNQTLPANLKSGIIEAETMQDALMLIKYQITDSIVLLIKFNDHK